MKQEEKLTYTRSCGNVFEDLELKNADILLQAADEMHKKANREEYRKRADELTAMRQAGDESQIWEWDEKWKRII